LLRRLAAGLVRLAAQQRARLVLCDDRYSSVLAVWFRWCYMREMPSFRVRPPSLRERLQCGVHLHSSWAWPQWQLFYLAMICVWLRRISCRGPCRTNSNLRFQTHANHKPACQPKTADSDDGLRGAVVPLAQDLAP
jgi:hypothetical protein